MKIYGRLSSGNVQKVMWALGELGLPHERIDAGGAFGKNREPDYLAKNPNGLVPLLDDGGFTLWESNTIVRYVAAKHDKAGALEPKDLATRARAQMWMDWQLTVSNPAMFQVFWGLIRTPPEKRDNDAIAAAAKKASEAMIILDGQLAQTKFVASDAFSYGDIPVGMNVHRYFKLVQERPELPNLKRWYDAVAARPAFGPALGDVPLT